MKDLLLPWTSLSPAFRLTMRTFEFLLLKGVPALVLTLLGVIVFWHIYTPIHELIHVGVCLLGGGTVEELALKPQYGGTLLKAIFPFIVAESDYAGQLTGFSTPNYFVYALVDMGPYILSLFGLTLVEWVRRRNQSFIFGLAVILTFIPFFSIPGDYYEAASLVTTQIAEAVDPSLAKGVLISDDFFKSVGQLSEAGQLNAVNGSLLAFGLLAAIFGTLFTLALQVRIARRIMGADIFDVPAVDEKTGATASVDLEHSQTLADQE